MLHPLPLFRLFLLGPPAPVWTTKHAKNIFASPASLLWVDPFTVPMNILHDVFHTLHNPTPSRYILLIDASLDEYTSCVTDFLRMNLSFGYFVGHKSNARPRTWEHHGVTMRDRRPVLCFFLQNTQAQTADPIHYHDVVRTLGHFLQLSGREKLSLPPKGLFLSTSGRFLKSEWWSVWNSETKSRSVMYNTRPVPWDEIGLSSQRVNALLPLCPLPHVRQFLPLTPSGNSPNIPLLLPTIGIYAIWSPYCSDIYIGAAGQTAVRTQKKRFPRFLKSLGRKPIERWRDHALKILRALSSKPGSKVCKMYSFMSRLDVESPVMTPIEECYAKDLFRIENVYIKHTKRPLNNRLPTNRIKQ